MSGARKVHIKSFGCQMNVYDSHRMADTLAPEGFAETATPEDADLVILNTCHIREKAAEKVYSELGRIRADQAGRRARGPPRGGRGRRLRRAGRGRGDHPPRAGGRPRGRPAELSPPAGAAGARRRRASAWSTPSFRSRTSSTSLAGAEPRRRRARAASPPSSPCRKAATSSAPSASCPIRAAPKSRGRSHKIVAEVERLADAGVREVTLIGQNVNAYHGDGPDGRPWTLGRLLHRIAEVPGIARLRYTTSHPCDVEDSLIAAHRDLPALMPYLHLPVQSGSDRILAAMNRRHTRADYLAAIARMRAARADMAFSSDFIVGFPGETEEDFARHAGADRRGRLCRRLSRSNIRRGRARRRPRWPSRCRRTSRSERLQRLQALIDAPAGRLQRALPRPHLRRAVREAGPPSWPDRRPLAISAAGPGHGAVGADRRRFAPVTITEVSANSLFGDARRRAVVERRQEPCWRTRRG